MMAALLLLLALCPPPAPYVAFGDSITVGNLASSPALGWARVVASPWALDNRAEGGTVVAEQLGTIQAYGGGATVALWLVCANDLRKGTPAEGFAATVQQGVDMLRGKGVERVFLNGVCLPFPEIDPTLRASYDAALATIHGATLVDIASGFLPSMFADGTHPNDAGHASIARAFWGALHRRIYFPVAISASRSRSAIPRPLAKYAVLWYTCSHQLLSIGIVPME